MFRCFRKMTEKKDLCKEVDYASQVKDKQEQALEEESGRGLATRFFGQDWLCVRQTDLG